MKANSSRRLADVGGARLAGPFPHRDGPAPSLGNSAAKVAPEPDGEIDAYNDHKECQDRVPLPADTFELRPDGFGLEEKDQDQNKNDRDENASESHWRSVSLESRNGR